LVRIMPKNRGRAFEDMIDYANEYYNVKGLAVIHKIPTPWKVIRKYSPFDNSYKIASAFPEKKSTVDFGGTASFQSIWFDAKATDSKTSFPLKNIHPHQMEYLKNVHNQGGKAFFLVYASHFAKFWLLWIDDLLKFIEKAERKSIPFSWFEENCAQIQPVIKPNLGVVLDYLPEVLKHREG
jgi:recombination protein U